MLSTRVLETGCGLHRLSVWEEIHLHDSVLTHGVPRAVVRPLARPSHGGRAARGRPPEYDSEAVNMQCVDVLDKELRVKEYKSNIVREEPCHSQEVTWTDREYYKHKTRA